MAEKKLTFEQAMARLEEIVAQLEAGDHPLAESLSLYEEGAKLMKQCVTMLDKAEQKVMKLRLDETGDLKDGNGFILHPQEGEAATLNSIEELLERLQAGSAERAV